MYDDDLGRGDHVSEPEVDEEEFEEESIAGQLEDEDVEKGYVDDDIDWERPEELFSDSFKFKEVEEELETTGREYHTRLERNIESLRHLRSESQEFLNEYTSLVGEQLTKFEDLKETHEDFVEEQLETFKNLRHRYNRLKKRTESLEDLKEDHVKLMNNYVHDLEDFAHDKLQDAAYKFVASGVMTTLGLGAAQFYDDDFGIPGFYLNSPEIYGDSPVMAALTLGLPALGALYLKSSIDSASEYADLKDDIDDLKKERRKLNK